MINQVVEEFDRQYTCLGENNEKYIIFSAPIEKEVTRIGKNGEKKCKNHFLQIKIC